MTHHRATAAALLAAGSLMALGAMAADNAVPYPTNYRSWQHVKSMVIEEGHPLYASFGGIHHLYANLEAMKGYATGKFPDGSIIAFDLLEAMRADGAVSEGARKVLGVMVKDSKRFATTGGWGFEGFGGGNANQRVVGDKAASACYACHTAQAGSDYVFSKARD